MLGFGKVQCLSFLNLNIQPPVAHFIQSFGKPIGHLTETGMAAIFNHKLRHAGTAVTRGTKYVLRSDVIYFDPEAKWIEGGMQWCSDHEPPEGWDPDRQLKSLPE